MSWIDETTRDDGLFIQRGPNGWMIFYRDVSLRHCPHCLMQMATERNARRLADAVFPEKRDDDSTC